MSMMIATNLAVSMAALCLVATILLILLRMLWPRRIRQTAKSLHIGFVHPDLGIGGAERLVVDAAVALQQAGHDVEIITASHERSHCFEETRDGTLQVVVFGSFLPRRVLGHLYAACAYLRMCWASARIVVNMLMPGAVPFDVIIVDQVSICIPILLLARPAGIIFYCHYPDYLLTSRNSWAKRLYRAPLDFFEEQTTGLADIIFVNSEFTAGVFNEAFPSLKRRKVMPDVLYPALNLEEQDQIMSHAKGMPIKCLKNDELLLLSVNRFERKKNVGLAIRTMAALPEELQKKSRLVLAGGYDEKLPENVEHVAELQALAEELGVAERVTQMRSVSAGMKAALLSRASCLLYTPDREHFGIVPVEAMYASVPVVAVNSGGPLESIAPEETGFLRPAKDSTWAEAVAEILADEGLKSRMGAAGRERVTKHFSLQAFGNALDTAVRRLTYGHAGKAE